MVFRCQAAQPLNVGMAAAVLCSRRPVSMALATGAERNAGLGAAYAVGPMNGWRRRQNWQAGGK